LKYAKDNLKINLSRKNIFLRDNNICQYCGKHKTLADLNIDHVIPRFQGGTYSWTNLVCSCIECNSKKGNKTNKEAKMVLLKNPTKPSLMILFKSFLSKIDDDQFKDWKHFFPDDLISEIYWNTELKE
jgi:hypothetical protein